MQTKNKGKYCWKFKLVNYIRYSLRFGIVIESKITKYAQGNYVNIGHFGGTSYCWDPGNGQERSLIGFGVGTNSGKLKPYGPKKKLESGDIVGVHLDFDNLTLSYSVNGKNYGISHKIKPEHYRCAVHVYDKEAVLELL